MRHGGFAPCQWVLSKLPRAPATQGDEDEFEDIGAFILRAGDTFDNTNNGATPEDFIGWNHIRSDNVGSNIIDEIAISNDCDALIAGPFAGDENLTNRCLTEGQRASAALATGLPDGYVGPGTYTVWYRQGTGTNVSTDLEFRTEWCGWGGC